MQFQKHIGKSCRSLSILSSRYRQTNHFKGRDGSILSLLTTKGVQVYELTPRYHYSLYLYSTIPPSVPTLPLQLISNIIPKILDKIRYIPNGIPVRYQVPSSRSIPIIIQPAPKYNIGCGKEEEDDDEPSEEAPAFGATASAFCVFTGEFGSPFEAENVGVAFGVVGDEFQVFAFV